MNVQEIAEFIVGNDLSYGDLVRLADQDGFATLMNPNVKKAQIILQEMGKISGNPIDIFNQYKISLEEYQRPRTLSSREDIDFDFSGIPNDKEVTVRGTFPTPSQMPLTSGSIKMNLDIDDLEGLYDAYGLRGEDRTIDNLLEKHEEYSKVTSLRPSSVASDVIKKTKHKKIIDDAQELAESTQRRSETNAELLKLSMPDPSLINIISRTPEEVINPPPSEYSIGMGGGMGGTLGFGLSETPKIERYEEGGYTNVYEDGVLVSIEQDGKVVVPLEKIDNQMRKNAQATYERRKEEERVAEYGIGMGGGMGGVFGFGPQGEKLDPTIEDLSETLKKDDPSKLKQLGQKVKEGYQDLSKEQKAMMGLIGLDVAGEVANYFGPARREGRQRLRELEERRERGQLGVDERQDAETMKYMTRPVRAMAEESEREQQAVMAGMGETRSAADLRRLRESTDAQMTDALSRAGQEVARQQMARKEMERRELNQLQAYQQENLRNLTNRISGAAAQMAGTFGANVAAEADIQRELDPEMIERKIQLLVEKGMDPAEARRKVQTQAIENARMFTGMRG